MEIPSQLSRFTNLPAILAAILVSVSASNAANKTWQVTSGDFLNAGNWTPSAPVAGDIAVISNSGTAILSTSGTSIQEVWVGQNASGTAIGFMNQTGGTLTLTDGLVVGRQGSAIGRYSMTGGTLTVNNLRLGAGTTTASGTMTVSGLGTSVTSGTGGGFVGVGTPGAGSLALSNSATWIHAGAGQYGIGFDNNTSGTFTATGIGAKGTLAINSGASLTMQSSGAFLVGKAGASGTVTVSDAGSALITGGSSNGFVGIGVSTGTGSVTLSNSATWTHQGSTVFVVGGDNNNSNQTGGTGSLTINTGASLSFTGAANLAIGRNPGSNGTVTVNGGSLTIGGAGSSINLVGQNGTLGGGTGTLTLTSGTISTARINSFEGNGTLNLNGGTINTGAITKGTGTAVAHFNGVTIRAASTNPLFTNFFSGFTTPGLDIQAGGLTFETGTAAVTFTQGLSGIGGLTKTGSNTLTMAGTSTYAGATTVSNGIVIVDGDISTSSGVSLSAGTVLGGHGKVSAISGAGTVGPGNSPGILTAASADLDAGMDFNFELTATNPTYNNATSSGNDVLHLTGGTPFPGASPADSDNVFNIYLGVASLANNDLFHGGIFADQGGDFVLTLDAGAYNYFVLGDGAGTHAFNGVNYYTLSEYNTANSTSWSILHDTFQVTSADFASGTVADGFIQEFQVAPEPGTGAMLLGGLGLLLGFQRRRGQS